mmetsp:Transcript_44981/g.66033  ORF Transcript_44981/g.66033 Transcript_44981/m.66033 type:complete len:99 (+) Transcript_44981:2-298(+)
MTPRQEGQLAPGGSCVLWGRGSASNTGDRPQRAPSCGSTWSSRRCNVAAQAHKSELQRDLVCASAPHRYSGVGVFVGCKALSGSMSSDLLKKPAAPSL